MNSPGNNFIYSSHFNYHAFDLGIPLGESHMLNQAFISAAVVFTQECWM